MGLNQFGSPDLSIPVDPSLGRTLIVGSNLGTVGYATVSAAVADAREGDTIFVQPGSYEENVVVTTDYITLRGGQVSGYGAPDISSASGVTLTVSAQGFVAVNCRFVASTSDCVLQEGNGFRYEKCVFDGDAGQAATDALLALKGNATDDSMTASEGKVIDCLFRGSDGFGIAFKGAESPTGVGSTHCVVSKCRFIDNVAADVVTRDNTTVNATYSVQDVLIEGCYFMEPKNKATWIDLTTSNGGAASVNTGTIAGCYFSDDTLDTTAVAMVGTGFTLVGCYSADGIVNGDTFD